jgi:hypothetical protein
MIQQEAKVHKEIKPQDNEEGGKKYFSFNP